MSESAPAAGARRSPLREQTTVAASAGRIYGMVLRYWYVIRSSWPRTAELITRFGRANLEEVFLAIARRGVEDGDDARSQL